MVQVVSDFGFGARRKSREEFVNTFEVVYFLKRSRILGEDVCLMRRYPGDWQVQIHFAFGNSGHSICRNARPAVLLTCEGIQHGM
jgi:hypothetical protein